jgi:hypothetical protein
MREVPLQSYRPRAKVRLIVRFDDFGAKDTPDPPERPPQIRSNKTKKTSAADRLEVSERDGALVLLAKGDSAGDGGAPQERTSSDDGRTHAVEVVPSTMTISRNGIRIADTMTATFRYADLPLDPRTIRACAVEAYAGSLPDEDADRERLGGEYVLLPDSYVDRRGNRRTNRRFSGWVDQWEEDLGDGKSEPTVSVECTDNTRLLIEQDAPAKLAVSPSTPIDRAIAEYLANFPQFVGLSVEYRPPGSDPPLLESALGRSAFKPKLGPTPGGGGKLNVWDYLTDVCGALGHVVRFEDSTVVVQRARTLYGSSFSGRPDDPFTGRVLPGGRELLRRLFVFGRNVTRPRRRREFARYAPTNIEVRCYVPELKKTLVVRHPQKGDRQKRVNTGNAAEQGWKVIVVSGIRDEATLRSIAQGAYEALGRNELGVEFETRDLASYGGDAADTDALDVLAGDALDLEVARSPDRLDTVGAVEEQLATRPADFLRNLGFPAGFADAHARALSSVALQVTYRVKTASIEWGVEEGISLKFGCVNYVEVRADKPLPAGEEPSATPPAGATPERVVVQEF